MCDGYAGQDEQEEEDIKRRNKEACLMDRKERKKRKREKKEK